MVFITQSQYLTGPAGVCFGEAAGMFSGLPAANCRWENEM